MSMEEKKSSHDDLDHLDALWANFRLPIPISSQSSEGKHDKGDDYPSSGHDDWLLELLDLFRLLQTMDHQYSNSVKDQNRARTSRVMNSQVALAYSTLWRVERTCPFMPRNAHENKAEEDSDRIFQRRIHILLQKARSRTEETCTRLKTWLDRPSSHPAQRHQKEQVSQERDLIHDIFLAPATPSTSSDGEDETNELLEEFIVEEGGDDNEDTVSKIDLAGQGSTHAQRHQPTEPPRKSEPEGIGPVKFQKQQQELLEEELASMASRLKSSTLAMNATLQSQTKELDEMEQLAQTNLDQVTDTTTKVEARLAKQRGWKKQMVTWSMIGTVIGMWVLCFVVMRTVPKRKIGKMNLSDRFRDGANMISRTLNRYFSTDEGENRSEDGEAQWRTQQRRWREWGQGYWQRQEVHRKQQECEATNDGTTTCINSQDVYERIEKAVHEIAAEPKQRYIVEDMINVPIVDPMESGTATDEKESTHDAGARDESSDDDQDRSHISDNPMGCIPPTEEMMNQQVELDSLRVALNQLENAIDRLPVGSTERLQLTKEQNELQLELNNLRSLFERERDKVMSINVKGRGTASGSFLFCEGEVLVGEFSYHEEDMEQERVLTKRDVEQARSAENRQERGLIEQAELERLEKERLERAEAERLKRERLAEMARIEVERSERERLAALIEQERVLNERMEEQKEAARLEEERLVAEAERLRQEKRAEDEAESLKQERLAEAARIEVERLERERLAALIEQERVLNERMEEQKEAARLEEERLVAEAERLRQERAEEDAKLNAEKLEEERLAVLEATTKAEFQKLEEERLAARRAKLDDEILSAEAERLRHEKLIDEATLGAKKAIDLALQIAADGTDFLPSDVRLAAGQQKNDLLAHYISVAPEMVDDSDKSGWRPIHEAARAGNLAGIQLLVSAGCDLTSRTGRKGNGGTALWWAIQRFGEDHGAVKLLRYHGALDAGPES